MKLATFMMPLHPPGKNYPQSLREDREAIILADELGYEEAYVGEHVTDAAENIVEETVEVLANGAGEALGTKGCRDGIAGAGGPPGKRLPCDVRHRGGQDGKGRQQGAHGGPRKRHGDVKPPDDNIVHEVVQLEVDFDGTPIWNGTPVPNRIQLDGYFLNAASQPVQPEIHLKPNRLAKYGTVARVLADAQKLGVKRIGFVGNEQYIE